MSPNTSAAGPAVRPIFPLSPAIIAALLALSTALFLVFPNPLWRAARDESHLLRFAFSYLAIVPLAALALHRRRRLRFDSLVTIVALVWGAKLVVTALLYQTVAPPRRAQLHAPDPNARAPIAAGPTSPALDSATELATLSGRIVDHARVVPGAVVALCNAAPSDVAPPVERPASIVRGTLAPSLIDATMGDRLVLGTADTAPHAVRGTAAGVSALSLAVVPGRASSEELSTLGTIALEVDGHPAGAVLVFEHSLHASTDREGRFRIADVPVGPRTLCVFVGATPQMHVVHAVVGNGAEATFDLGSAS